MRLKALFVLLLALCLPLINFAAELPPAPILTPDDQQEAPIPGQPSTVEETPVPPTYEHALGKMLLTLLGLLLLIILTIWMLRRLGTGKIGKGSGQTIKILERRPISQKSILYLIEVEGKQVLISESQLEVRKITSVEAQLETE